MNKTLTLTMAALLTLSSGLLEAQSRGHHHRHEPPRPNSQHGGHHWNNGRSHGHDHRLSHREQRRLELRAQQRLRELRYYRGRVDGDFGPGTRQALVRFQRDYRLPVTGYLDTRTVRALRIR